MHLSLQMPKPSISMPNAVSTRPGFDNDESQTSPKHGSSIQGQNQHQPIPAGQVNTGNEQPKKGPPSKDNKSIGNNQRYF